MKNHFKLDIVKHELTCMAGGCQLYSYKILNLLEKERLQSGALNEVATELIEVGERIERVLVALDRFTPQSGGRS